MIHDYYGLDIGDGETAVATVREGSQVEPQILSVRGTKSMITALGISRDGTRYIGEEAFQIADIERLHLRFKRNYLQGGEPRQWMEDFARTLRENMQAEGHPGNVEGAKFFIGCPSGWDAQARESYQRQMEQAGFPQVRIISESRAALVYARESGELRVGTDLLGKPTLIIDAGSSTTDYTYIAELQERQLTDAGEVALGGGILDGLLLEYNVVRHPEREKLEGYLRDYPPLLARCEMEARKVKEMYFIAQQRGTPRSYPFESPILLYTQQPPLLVNIVCDDAIMESLLHTPLDILAGRSYLAAYEHSLKTLREGMEQPPEVILLTGGATNMPFMRDIAETVFPNATIVKGNEPEFAIARGLCYALRMDERRAGFLEEVAAMIQSDAVETIVEENLKALFSQLAPLLVEQIVTTLAPQVFRRWRSGEIPTLSAMLDTMATEGSAFMQSEAMHTYLRPVIAAWLNTLRPQLEAVTNPICDQYGLPRTSLRLPNFISVVTNLPIEAEKLVDFTAIKWIIDVIIATVVGALAGGTGTALLMTGPFGVVIGIVIGLAAAIVGTEMAERMLMERELPVRMRAFIREKSFLRSLDNRRDEMTAKLNGQLWERVDERTPEIQETIDNIAKAIEQQLTTEMEQAVLLIR